MEYAKLLLEATSSVTSIAFVVMLLAGKISIVWKG